MCTMNLLAAEAGQTDQIRTKNGILGKRNNVKSGGQDRHLPLGYAGRKPKKHHDPKVEEGRDFKEGKKGWVKAAKEPRTIILD